MPSHLVPNAHRAQIGLILGAILIGLSAVFVRLSEVGPTAAAFWRVALALPALAAMRAAAPAPGPAQPAQVRALWLSGLAFAGDLAVWHQSIRLTTVANATLLANLAPVFLTLALRFGFGLRQQRRFWAGLVLAVAGAFVLMAGSMRLGSGAVIGDLCGVGAAVFYGTYQLLVSVTRRSFSATEVMLRSSAISALVLLPIALVAGETLWPHGAGGWLALAALALISHVGGQGLIAWALASVPPAFASVALLVQPVAAAVFAWLILGEAFGATQAVGGAIVLGGILLCRMATFGRAQEPQPE
jgi:drug/metabolite transporter (DMT)-like permease